MRSDPEIYNPTAGPFVAWLHCSGDKREFARLWHQVLAPQWQSRRFVRILDMGCGAGHTARMLIRTLRVLGINFEYLGVSPHSEQVAAFNTAMVNARARNARAVSGSLETFEADEPYDVVIANHSLYYAKDLAAACAKLMALGREVVIAHHGELGIDEVHRALPRVVNATYNTVSTYQDVLRHLPTSSGGERRARVVGIYTALVDIRSCLSEWDPIGEQLMSFLVNRRMDSLSPGEFQQIREWLRGHCHGPFLTHNVGAIHVK